LFRGDVDSAAPISRAAIEQATRVGLECSLPWQQGLLGYAHALKGEFETAVTLLKNALEKSQQIHLLYLTPSIGVLLAETLAPRQPQRALDLADTSLGVARARGFRAQEAELLRVKAAALLSLDAKVMRWAERPSR
jgi:tetratricopeptide (TPR) repeat protein